MEIYLAAVVRFFFKPRLRLWQPEGQVNLVTIIAPHIEEKQLTKSYGADEAQQRLAYLADVIDTQGWAARGVSGTALASLNDTITAEASTVDDIMDESIGIGRQFDSLIEQQDAIRKQQMTQQFQAAMQQPSAPPAQEPALTAQPSQAFTAFPQTPSTQPTDVPASEPTIAPSFNPYPTAMHQHVIDPHGTPAAAAPPPSSATIPTASQPAPTPPAQQPVQNASDEQPSPDIMRLASNRDLSISAIAREAHRLEDNEEVVISLH